MNYAEIKPVDIANGKGVRVSLFVSGCRRKCPGCFNEPAWDFSYGEPYTGSTLVRILELCAPRHISGLSILGGEPLEPENQGEVLTLIRAFKESYPEKDIWLYTGFTVREVISSEYDTAKAIIASVDVVVEGPFVEELRNPSLAFRGSSNQLITKIRNK